MKICLLFLAIFTINVNAQTFKLKDSVFEVGDSIILDIRYDYDKASVRPESWPLIDSLAMLMKKNPLAIQVANHTDCRGNDMYNLKLSEMRAKEARYCIIWRNQIPESRLVAVGYGESKPIVPEKKIKEMATKDEQEKAHQLNRRTVFTIIKLNQ